MTRTMIFALIVLGSTATAIAAIAPGAQIETAPTHNVTVIEKNQAFPVFGPIIVEECDEEDYEDVDA